MPIITSCPQCNTQFIVKKEQLKAYEGQVRCGTCHHVFNANEHLVKPTKTKSAAIKKPKVSPATETESARPVITAETEHIEITSPTHLQDAFYQEIAQEIKLDASDTALQSPSVVKDLSIDSRFSKKPKKKFSWLFSLMSLILFLALFAQLVYFLRTEISAYYPNTKPWLALACQHVGCQVNLPQKIDLLTIDDSDIQEHLEYEGVLLFSSTLVNHAPYAQAYPKIELTLTNTDDEPVLRRTFEPKDYLDKEINVDDGMSANHESHIKLSIHPDDVAVAGYRVSLAY